MEKQKILMLEDNNSDAELIKEELIVHKFDFTSELVETEKDFIAAIHGFKPDIILSDYNLPQFTGFEALKIAKKLVPDIPFIMITGSLSEETAADSIKRGAWDYILKENLTRLTSAIENALKLKEEKDKNKQAEETLKASEERYRVLFETAKDSIFITDESGKFLDVNQAACKSLGYSKEELLKMRNQDLDYETTGYEAFKKIRNGLKEDITFEVNQIRKDGNLLPVEISGNSYFIEDKTLFIAIARDFSYRKQAEEKEKEHHKNIELLSKTAMQFVDFPHDKDIYTFIGEQLQELIVKDSYVIVNSTDTESKTLITRAIIGIGKLSEKVASLIGKNPTGMTYNVEDEDLVYLSDGKLHLYEEGLYGISLKTIPKTVCKSIEKLLNIKSIFTIGLIKDNKLFGTLSILLKEDTGELKNKQLIETFIKQASIAVQKKQAEDALKESNENYQQVISNITAVVWKADIGENGAFENTYFSPVLDELLELPAGTMKNDWDKYFGYIKPEYLERVNNAFREAIISPGKKIDCEYEVLKDNGQTVWVHSIGSRFEKNGKMYVFGSTSDITERKKAEKKINLLSNIVKQSMEGMAQVDLNGNLIFINNAWCEMHGYKSYKELLGKNLTIFHNKEQIENDVISFNEKVKKYGTYSGEVGHVTKDGKLFPTLMTSTVLKDDKGTPYGIAGIAKDITERKQAEEALRDSEELYRMLFKSANDAIFIMKDDIFIECNHKTLEIFGCTREQIIGHPPYEFSPPTQPDGGNSKEKAMEKINGALSGKMQVFEWKHIKYDGTPFDADVSLSTIELVSGLHIQAIVRNITERKQAKEALRLANENTKTILEKAPIGIVVIGRDRKIKMVNDTALKMAGIENADIMLGKNCSEYLCPAQQNECPILNKGQQVDNSERIFRRKDGKEIPIIKTVTEININGENVLLETFVDITERKQAEDAIRTSKNKLQVLYDSSSDAIMLLDEKGFFDCNKATLRLFGCSTKEEFCGMHPADFSPQIQPDGTDSMRYAKNNIAFALKKGSKRFEHLHRRLDGTDFPAEVLLNALVLGGKKVLQARVFDITERKQAEEELYKRLNELETFNRVTVGRELKMVELKKEINELLVKYGKESKYKIAE